MLTSAHAGSTRCEKADPGGERQTLRPPRRTWGSTASAFLAGTSRTADTQTARCSGHHGLPSQEEASWPLPAEASAPCSPCTHQHLPASVQTGVQNAVKPRPEGGGPCAGVRAPVLSPQRQQEKPQHGNATRSHAGRSGSCGRRTKLAHEQRTKRTEARPRADPGLGGRPERQVHPQGRERTRSSECRRRPRAP